mmetsp:Transcript_14371/g.2349  ORF Transcript_14371/g.2349 Transcript_14371/m.2349 type:complete len:90 (+) Transcript_14371:31-300(+)
MARLESYRDLTKNESNLLGNYFCSNHNFGVYLKQSLGNGLSGYAKLREYKEDNKTSAALKLDAKQDNVSFSGLLTTANDFKGTFSFNPK